MRINDSRFEQRTENSKKKPTPQWDKMEFMGRVKSKKQAHKFRKK